LAPHDEVALEPPLLLALLAALEVAADAALLLELLLLELLPHAARTTRPITAVSARVSRTRGTCPNTIFSSSS
jgi:hypothetical protein